ncbi:unnamed protein product, partial [Parascedosporium putredinis]
MKDIFLVGACYVDTILSVPHYPEEDSKLRAESLAVRRGGNCPNSLEEGVEEPASSFIVRSLRTGSRTIVNYNGIDEMTVEEFKTVVARFTAGKNEAELGKNGS